MILVSVLVSLVLERVVVLLLAPAADALPGCAGRAAINGSTGQQQQRMWYSWYLLWDTLVQASKESVTPVSNIA
jgi:hypothetical protein